MPNLEKELAKTIDDLIQQSYHVFDKENTTLSLQLLEKAWDLLPLPKENWQESYYIAQNIIHAYLQGKNIEQAIAYLPTFMRCDQQNRNYGESEFLAGKLAFDRGQKIEALDYFIIAGHKGGKRIFNGVENKKYKDFYTNHPSTAAKIKAYKVSLKPKQTTPDITSLEPTAYPIFRQLEQTNTEKICRIAYKDKSVWVEIGKPPKTKITIKTFSTPAEAILHWKKKEVEWLKKGYIYRNPNAMAGMATMHCFIGTGYTGALSFEPSTNGIYVSKVGWNNKTPKELIKDTLILIDRSGVIKEEIDLPAALPWDICYNALHHSLFIYLDKRIYQYNIHQQTFTPLSAAKDWEHKQLSTAANCLAFSTKQQLLLTNNISNLHQKKFDLTIPRSNPSFALTLSSDAQLLAIQRRQKTLDIIDCNSLQTIITLDVSTKSIGQMAFTKDNKMVVFIDMEGYWNVRFFSLETQQELFFKDIQIPPYEYAFYFAFNSDNSKLAITYRNTVKIFDFQTQQFLHEFQFEHSIKKASIKFVGDLLGVRTDYGFFSLYRV